MGPLVTVPQSPDLHRIRHGGTESWTTIAGVTTADAITSLGEDYKGKVLIRCPAHQSALLVFVSAEDPGIGELGEGAISGGWRAAVVGNDRVRGEHRNDCKVLDYVEYKRVTARNRRGLSLGSPGLGQLLSNPGTERIDVEGEVHGIAHRKSCGVGEADHPVIEARRSGAKRGNALVPRMMRSVWA